jgi:excisionase family DNA binding protein
VSPSQSFMAAGTAAAELGVHPSTLRRWADEGHIPCIKLVSGTRRYRADDIERMRRYLYDDELRAALETPATSR